MEAGTVAADYLADFHAEMKRLAAPLQAQLASINEEIVAAQARLEELRKARSEITSVLRKIDPELAPPLYAKNGKPPKGSTRKGIKQGNRTAAKTERLARYTDFLQAHRDELNEDGGFRGTDLGARSDFAMETSLSALHDDLRDLHDGGVLLLDRKLPGRPTPDRLTGTFYKVV